jgi:hypothetical protein
MQALLSMVAGLAMPTGIDWLPAEPVLAPVPRTVTAGLPGPATGRQEENRNRPMSWAALASTTQKRVPSHSAPEGIFTAASVKVSPPTKLTSPWPVPVP